MKQGNDHEMAMGKDMNMSKSPYPMFALNLGLSAIINHQGPQIPARVRMNSPRCWNSRTRVFTPTASACNRPLLRADFGPSGGNLGRP